MSLPDLLRASSDLVFVYGTTPPRLDTPPEKYAAIARRLTERVQDLALDGLVVYDVQDESERMQTPRPFPFLPTYPSRTYAAGLWERTGLPVITYKCIAALSEEEWLLWLEETAALPLRCLSLVGRASSAGGPTGIALGRALALASTHSARFALGGVVIPERHRPEAGRSESVRLLQKMEAGCDYFISQAIYDAAAAIRLIQDYHVDCQARNIRPRRILLTFTPCGRPKTLEFMKWLGVHIPPAVETTLATSADPLTASVDLCIRNWRVVLDSGIGDRVPLGVNVESISNSKEEIAASIALCRTLRAV